VDSTLLPADTGGHEAADPHARASSNAGLDRCVVAHLLVAKTRSASSDRDIHTADQNRRVAAKQRRVSLCAISDIRATRHSAVKARVGVSPQENPGTRNSNRSSRWLQW